MYRELRVLIWEMSDYVRIHIVAVYAHVCNGWRQNEWQTALIAATLFFIIADQASSSQRMPVPSPYQSVPVSPTMPPQTPTCPSNAAFTAFNGRACLSSIPHGSVVPSQYHMAPYCGAADTYGTFSHVFHSAMSPFSPCAGNGIVSQSDSVVPISPIVSHQANGFQGNNYALAHAFAAHTGWTTKVYYCLAARNS